ncbi:hypothetical protein [Marinomonas sp. TW1]|uniref:hypothetical protein n=1 Tax=Marinomonas sp. TW1 TaxID=1561203 RepID=UPI0007AFD2FC|nr:hypothetical protein [Marinomonas sp. TW1]KZN12596.1 hypothetical protein OA79_15065 [Marinomonas sp. TW1]
MSDIIEELQLVKRASQEQTAASNALSEEVAGKMKAIDDELVKSKIEFDKYLTDQNPIFSSVSVKNRLIGKTTQASFSLSPGESKVLMTNLSPYISANGILAFHLNHGSNGAVAKYVSFSGYGLTESDLGNTSSRYINLSVVRSSDPGGEHLNTGRCELSVKAPETNEINVGVYVNFVLMSAVGVAVASDILI